MFLRSLLKALIRHRGKDPLCLLAFFLLTAGPASAEKSAPVKPAPVDLTQAIADVVRKAMPAVVHIEVTQRVELSSPQGPFESDPFFRYFFGPPPGPRIYKKEMRGIGSGMILDGEGHILTNFHVISGASRIVVKTSAGEEFEAKVAGSDPTALRTWRNPATLAVLCQDVAFNFQNGVGFRNASFEAQSHGLKTPCARFAA